MSFTDLLTDEGRRLFALATVKQVSGHENQPRRKRGAGGKGLERKAGRRHSIPRSGAMGIRLSPNPFYETPTQQNLRRSPKPGSKDARRELGLS